MFTFRSVVAAMVALALVVCGCASRELQVRSQPPGATVTVDGAPSGTTPTKVKFDFSKKTYYDVSLTKTGYIQTSQTVIDGGELVNRGYVSFDLVPDEAYAQTTVSDAANTWRRIAIAKQFNREAAWQRMVDSVTTRYSNLEQMDQASGYLRSVAVTKVFKHPVKGDYSVRTYFIGTIAQAEPLVYKVKIVAERSESPSVWTPYGRIFAGDQELVEELQDRLGMK